MRKMCAKNGPKRANLQALSVREFFAPSIQLCYLLNINIEDNNCFGLKGHHQVVDFEKQIQIKL
jgi:hypothetical protein